MEKYKLSLIILLVSLLTGCSRSRQYFPRTMEREHIQLVRFDRALMNVNTSTALNDIRLLYDEYPVFMSVWTEDILGIPASDTSYLATALPQFLEDTVYGFKETNERARELFADTRDIEHDLDNAFTRIHYLYPEWPMPDIYLFVSGFNASILFVDDHLAAGVDMYLGSDWKYYNQVVHHYQRQTMRKECLAMDVTSAYLFRHIDFTSSKSRLLEQMLYRGKVMYLLSVLFDQAHEWEVMGWSKEQWQWCHRNERAIWNHMMDKRDLFRTENMVLASYLNDGPFTAEISQDSPGRVGTWIGWQITRSYMEHHPEVSLQQLMAEPDAQKILEQSYYKP